MVVGMRRWPLLQHRDYMLLWSGEILSELGSQSSAVAYPLLILALTGSAAKAGVVGLAKWLPLAVFAIPAGALADRIDRKRLMIGCDAVRMVGAASIVVMLVISAPSYGQILAVAFVDGALFTTSYVCERGALRQVVPTEHVQDAVAQNEARSFAAAIIGPPLGGALFAIARALPFIFDTVSFLSSMTMLSLTRARFQSAPSATPAAPRTIRSDVADGFAWLWQHPFFRTTSMLFALGNPVFTGLYLLAILLAKQHGASAATVGLMLAIVGVGGLLGALCAGTIRRAMTARTMILTEQLLLVGAVLALLLVQDALLIGVLIAASELMTPAVNSVVAGARVAAAPDRLQGRVQAAATMATMSLAWLGPLAVGVFFEHWGSTTTILILAGWMLIPLAIAAMTRALHGDPLRLTPAVSG
jgi:predicted MFS family arabinose efflux permease